MRVPLCFVLIILCVSALQTAAQTSTDSDPKIVPFPEISRSDRERRDREAGVSGFPASASIKVDPSKFPPLSANQMAVMIERSNADAKMIPPLEYIKKYYTYSTSAGMGLTRVFPDKNCGKGTVVTVAEVERCADVPLKAAGGSLYNFRAVLLSGLRKNAWLLHYENGKFNVGNEIVQGIMADLGDIDIETVGLDHKAFKFLQDYDPKQKVSAIAEEKKIISSGIDGNGYRFSNSLEPKIGSTFALRSVIYRYNEEGAAMPNRGFEQYIVFKIVGKESDGSVIFIWKELLREFPRRKIEK